MSLLGLPVVTAPGIIMADREKQDDKWTADVVTELQKLVAEKLSAREIAAAISRHTGEFYSRNAVIGKVRRLKLALLGTTIRPVVSTKPKKPKAMIINRPLQISSKPVVAPTLPTLAEVVANPKCLTILEIQRGQCYWPTNLNGVTLFCGHNTGSSECSWCPPHRKLAYTPPYQRYRRPLM